MEQHSLVRKLSTLKTQGTLLEAGVALGCGMDGWTGGMETGAVLSKEATKTTPNRLARLFVGKVQVTSIIIAVDACRPRTN